MEKVIAFRDNIKLMVDEFKKQEYVFRMGQPIYRVYEKNTFIFQSSDLFSAYLKFLHPHMRNNGKDFIWKTGEIWFVFNAKRCKNEKVFGVYDNLTLCAKDVYHMIGLFTSKSANQADAQLNWLEYIFRGNEGYSLDKKLLPFLEIRAITMNQMMVRESKIL